MDLFHPELSSPLQPAPAWEPGSPFAWEPGSPWALPVGLEVLGLESPSLLVPELVGHLKNETLAGVDLRQIPSVAAAAAEKLPAAAKAQPKVPT